MRFWVKNRDGFSVYHYADDGDNHTCQRCVSDVVNGKCTQDRYAYSFSKGNKIFTFCYDKNIPSKQVKFMSKIACCGYEQALSVQNKVQEDLASFETIALHNVRKLTAVIGQKIDSIASEEDAYNAQDKVLFYRNGIESNINQASKELLSIRKSINQIEFEYNAIDAYRNTGQAKDTWLTEHKAHTVVVMAFYMYEQELRDKKIWFNIDKYNGYILVDFSMARSAISQILSNSVKYCKDNSHVHVKFIESNDYLDILFEMQSLFFTNDEAKLFMIRGVRGLNSKGTPGDGIGMYAAALMMQHNGGNMLIRSNEATRYQSGDQFYSANEFVLTFKRRGGHR